MCNRTEDAENKVAPVSLTTAGCKHSINKEKYPCTNVCQDCGTVDCEGKDTRNYKNVITCAKSGSKRIQY